MYTLAIASLAASVALGFAASPVSAQDFSNNMDVVPGAGWTIDNNSSPLGATTWQQGADTTFPSQAGAPNSYASVNYNSTRNVGTISNWLISPVTTISPGSVLKFWTRTVSIPAFPDRMQVRFSSSGASVNTGTSATDFGAFDTLLLDINPTYTLAGYPTAWTEITLTITAQQAPIPTTGRFAFRYFVEDGGFSGTRSDYIGLDTVSYVQASSNSCATLLPPCTADVSGDNSVNVTDLLAVIGGWGQIGPPRPTGDCAPVPFGDCTVNVTDLLGVISDWGNCAVTGACMGINGACIVTSFAQCNAIGGGGWTTGFTCIDADADRIPDFVETNDCAAFDGIQVGTNPTLADTDSDGIKDGDETYGTLGGLDLPAMGANPCRKDLFVEADWLHATAAAVDRNKPATNQMNRVIAAFNNSPVTNPNGVNGVALHVDYGQGGAFTNGTAIVDPSGNDTLDMTGSLAGGEFYTVKAANFAANRNGYFHYCLFHDKYSINGSYQNSSGFGELPGDDFLVSMGQWFIGDHNFIGNTFMHELGHNIGLQHGGNESLNFKPNYNSIMNYWNQFCGTDTNNDTIPDNALDYSRGLLITLNESSLSEPNGVTGSGPAINWNGDGDSTDIALAFNINCRVTSTFANSNCLGMTKQPAACGTFGNCGDSTCDTYSDFNDWANIVLNSLSDADFAEPEIIHCWIDGRGPGVRR